MSFTLKPGTILHVVLWCIISLAGLGGCASVTPEAATKAVRQEQQRALAHHPSWQRATGRTNVVAGDSAGLVNWYGSWNDRLLLELQERAQTQSPNLEAAQARVAQSRALLTSAQAGTLPTLDLNSRLSRARNVLFPPGLLLNTATILIDTAWEIDVWGANKMGVQAADQRLLARAVSSQELSAALAVEVAQSHVGILACAMAQAVARQDTALVAANEKLVRVRVQAGLAPATELNQLVRLVTEARQREQVQDEQCELGFKALSALTLVNEQELRAMYRAPLERVVSDGLPKVADLPASSVPAEWIDQRPDMVALALELEAAQFDIGVTDAARYPRLALTGQIGPGWVRSQSIGNSNGTSWNVVPTLGLPLFDAGRRKADVSAAKARYSEAAAQYRDRAAQAVREVEEAMVRIDSAASRLEVQRQLLEQTLISQKFVEQLLSAGLSSSSELNDAQRQTLNARQQVVAIERDALLARLALFKALGSGWQGVKSAEPIARQGSNLPNKKQ